jgi:uracil-DNA glycosylase family 4
MSDVSVELNAIADRVVRCQRCPRLREYCAGVAKVKRKAFADWTYWGRPVPSFGDPGATIVIVGLAPAAHGANRTGRMFTGDRSGDFLYAALHRTGLANQPTSVSRDDGLTLRGVYITAAAHCAPPGNRPLPEELKACQPFLEDELRVMQPAVTFCLGSISWNAAIAAWAALGETIPRPRPKFGHAAECRLATTTMLGCYHVSQQNTFTGRLTEPMLDKVLKRAAQIAAKRR